MSHMEGAYTCLPYSVLNEKPYLLRAFRRSGCDPEGIGEVGIVLTADLHEAEKSQGG